jgi:hypothetical protein
MISLYIILTEKKKIMMSNDSDCIKSKKLKLESVFDKADNNSSSFKKYHLSDCIISLSKFDKFDEKDKLKWECPICMQPCYEAMEWSCCKGITCSKCCERNEKHVKCMICATPTSSNNANAKPYTPMLFVRSIINSCETKCLSDECGIVLIVDNLKHHLKNECKFLRLCDCSCAYELLNSNFQIHNGQCPQVLIDCINDCGIKKFERKNLQEHLRVECPKALTQCEFCHFTDFRSNIKYHQENFCKVRKLENRIKELESQVLLSSFSNTLLERELILLNPGPFVENSIISAKECNIHNAKTYNILPPLCQFESFNLKQNENKDLKILIGKIINKSGIEMKYNLECKIEFSRSQKLIVVTSVEGHYRWFLKKMSSDDDNHDNDYNHDSTEPKINKLLVKYNSANYKSLSVVTNRCNNHNFIIPAMRAYFNYANEHEYPFFTQKNSDIYHIISFHFEGNGARPSAETLFNLLNSILIF